MMRELFLRARKGRKERVTEGGSATAEQPLKRRQAKHVPADDVGALARSRLPPSRPTDDDDDHLHK